MPIARIARYICFLNSGGPLSVADVQPFSMPMRTIAIQSSNVSWVFFSPFLLILVSNFRLILSGMLIRVDPDGNNVA